jgi:uncharacterized membrane protein YeaQ/YmgE (transglycosylase-associated protein family)
MDIVTIIIWIVLGAIAGGIAGFIMKSSSGLIVDIIVGIVGAIIGGWVLSLLGIQFSQVGGLSCASIVTAVIGAVILLAILRLIRR